MCAIIIGLHGLFPCYACLMVCCSWCATGGADETQKVQKARETYRRRKIQRDGSKQDLDVLLGNKQSLAEDHAAVRGPLCGVGKTSSAFGNGCLT